ncbi:MAG TPA: hypothetical protein VGR27_06480 [Longimicrobiaceae bacterium]|nr:hypothetical protein [Longimicrobiaceae bacterium]
MGLGLLALHIVLLFLPLIPPDLGQYVRQGGSLWSYLFGYVAVILLLIELKRSPLAVVEWWRQIPPARRWLAGVVAVASTLGGALALRAYAPRQFVRFSGEEGLWEPLTLFCYFGAAVLLGGVARSSAAMPRKPLKLLAGLYLVLALEEIDYFGIFGAFIGRIDGVYAGSLHDIIRLAAEKVLPAVAAVCLAGAALLVLTLFWRGGYLDPRWLLARIRSREFAWVILGMSFLAIAAVQDADLFGWVAAQPSTEEALELIGALCLAVYALEVAVRGDPSRSRATARSWH